MTEIVELKRRVELLKDRIALALIAEAAGLTREDDLESLREELATAEERLADADGAL